MTDKEVVEKTKKIYFNCYKNYLLNLQEGFSEDISVSEFYRQVAIGVNNLLCEVYGDLWIKEVENESL